MMNFHEIKKAGNTLKGRKVNVLLPCEFTSETNNRFGEKGKLIVSGKVMKVSEYSTTVFVDVKLDEPVYDTYENSTYKALPIAIRNDYDALFKISFI